MKTFYTPPKILQKMFPSFIWESKVDKILFSFDDGPNPETTETILESLRENNIKAIFFCVGENIAKYPLLVRKIITEGHTIANHSYSHQNITFSSKLKINEQIELCSKAIIGELGDGPKYYRPPHGRFDHRTNKILQKQNLTNVMWSLLTYDYKNDLNIVKFAVQKNLTKKSIIVMHDSNKSKDIIVESINLIVEEADKNGFQIGEPSECLS